MKPTVYLAGPMSSLTWEEASRWREKANLTLQSCWRVLTPIKGQRSASETKGSDIIPSTTQQENQHLPLQLTATGIVSQDKFYIDQSDWLLVNFAGATVISIGTIWEMGYARAKNKFIISVLEPGAIHDHPFVRRNSNIFVPTLDEALNYLMDIAV